MPDQSPHRFCQCYISAPFGIDLGSLPEVLKQREISWEWAEGKSSAELSSKAGLAEADFIIVILNGTKADYSGIFDAGMAVGLRKPILLIKTKSRVLPIDFGLFSIVKTSLSNQDALSFHLDLFLSTPPSPRDFPASASLPSIRVPRSASIRYREQAQYFSSKLEERVYQAVISAGGAAILEPKSASSERYRPDLLAWLGNIDAEVLDPVVIEVKDRVALGDAQRLEERLLGFTQSARVRIALIVTAEPAPVRHQQLSPNVLWLTVDEFESLMSSAELGTHVRTVRNRIAHGAN